MIENSNKSYSENYKKTLDLIEEGNQYVIKNDVNDDCFPYRYFHRGCYYNEKKNYLIASSLQGYNLTSKEIINLCYKFAHKGGTSYCLWANKELEKCLDFAKNNDYLIRICGLEEKETIPFNGWWTPGYREDPIPRVEYSDLL